MQNTITSPKSSSAKRQGKTTENSPKSLEIKPVFKSLESKENGITEESLIESLEELSVDVSLKQTLNKFKIDPSEKLEPPQRAWEQIIGNTSEPIILGTLGNFSLLIGKAKSRKSFFIAIAISVALKDIPLFNQLHGTLPSDQRTVLYFDTEQSKYHVQLAVKRICRLIEVTVPTNLKTYHLRSMSPRERLELIEYAIYNTPNLGFVVIDGIKDLITSINSEEEATEISSKLLKWTEEKNIHIITVLHQNKNDNNARGHIGTELNNKAETVLSIAVDSKNKDRSIVEAEFCRNREPEPFAFEIIDNVPMIVEDYIAKTNIKNRPTTILDLPDSEKYGLLSIVFSNGVEFTYQNLVNQIKKAFKAKYDIDSGDNRIKEFITVCKDKRWLLQEAERQPYTLGNFTNNNKQL